MYIHFTQESQIDELHLELPNKCVHETQNGQICAWLGELVECFWLGGLQKDFPRCALQFLT